MRNLNNKGWIVTAYFMFLISISLSGQDLSGPEIITKVNQILNPYSSKAKIQMILHNKKNQTRTFVYESWSLDHGEKNLVKNLEPHRTRGQATLMLNYADDIWMYFPRTKRVRKLASHAKKQKMEGSDFSYEDMGSGDAFINDFTAKRLDNEKLDGTDCYVLSLMKKEESDPSYSQIIMWIRQDNFVPIRLDYYDENHPDRVKKRLVQSNIKMIDGIPTAMHMEMKDLTDGTKTEMTFQEVFYNLELDASLFSERGLRK